MEDEAKHLAEHPPRSWKFLQALGAMTLRWRSGIFFACLLFSWQVAKIPGDVSFWEETPWSYLPKAWLESSRKKPNDRVEPENNPLRRMFEWWFGFRNLDLQEEVLTANALSPKMINALRTEDAKEREEALKEVVGLNLKGRDLRHANLSGAVLPEADMRPLEGQPTQLQGADLRGAQLQGAHLDKAWIRADLYGAQLQDAKLWEADLQGAILVRAQLQGAHLGAAQLQNALLNGAQLQGAYLSVARMQGAHLDEARMQGADLEGAQPPGYGLGEGVDDGRGLGGGPVAGRELGNGASTGSELGAGATAGRELREWADIKGADFNHANLDFAGPLGSRPPAPDERRVSIA